MATYKKTVDDKLRLAAPFIKGDINFIKIYSTASSKNLKYALTTGFEHAAYNGQFKVVKFLLTSKKLNKNADIHHANDYALNISSFNGHLDIVKYLLTSKVLKEHADIHARQNSSLIWAAEANQLDVVEYLLESSELKENADINLANTNKCNAFMGACNQNSLSVIKYLVQRKNLNIKQALYKLNTDNKDGFMLACENHERDTDIIDFIVFEMNFQPTARHKNYFKENAQSKEISYAEKIINIRNLNQKLNLGLNEKNQTVPKNKI